MKQSATSPTPPKPPKPKRSVLRRLAALWPVAVIAIAVGGFYMYSLSDIHKAGVGDCASYDAGDATDPYSRASCGSDSSTLRVLQLVSINDSCRDVAGATQSTRDYSTGETTQACLGPKDADPANSINVAQKGDCLTGADERAQRVPCTDPTVAFTILERYNDVAKSQVGTSCTTVPRATDAFAWTWQANGTGPQIQSLEVDAMFCLERVKE